MGAETSSLKDYNLGQPYLSNGESAINVTVCPASNSVDNKKYTVFQYPKENGKLNASIEKNIEV